MQSGTIILGITGALALAAVAVGCGGETTSGAGGGTTASATGSGSSTAAATSGSGATATASSTGTGAATCPFASGACEMCLMESCAFTQCKGDPMCLASFDMMRKGCACTAQLMMDKAGQNACISQFANDAQFAMNNEAGAQISCVGSNCQALCYLPQ